MNGTNLSMLVCAVRGPIMLITLGALFVIDQNGGYSFSRTWPILIIVFGLMKLLERAAVHVPSGNLAPPGGPGTPGGYQS
jgi:hypothetical protein